MAGDCGRCPDDGTCHHNCGVGYCFRVEYCEPLTIAGWGDRWPSSIQRLYGTPQSTSEAERARLCIRPVPRPNPGPERRTHGRHCPCKSCCRQDWSAPGLAPCGMHGSDCPPVYDPYCTYDNYPPPRLSVRPVLTRGDSRDMVLPRPYLYLDGDFTNSVINVGINVGTDGGDALFTIGLDLVIPPRLFWLVNWLYRRDGRDLVK